MRRLLKLTIENDPDTESPNEWDGWKLYSFSNRHNSFKHPDFLLDENGNMKIGYQSKFRAGTAFWLDYFEHGQCSWSLSGEGMQCQWDTARHGGVLIWEQDVSNLGAKSYEDRAKDARVFCETYTDWANGNCYWFELETMDGEDVDSSGGFIGDDGLEEAIKESLGKDDLIIEVTGEAKWLTDYMKLPIDTDYDEEE